MLRQYSRHRENQQPDPNIGVRTKSFAFSQRRDSLTIFARDEAYGYTRKAGAWTGPDKDLVARARKILRAAKIPDGEIRRIKSAIELSDGFCTRMSTTAGDT